MIIGPTASGKTGLAHRLALKTGGAIISVDSRQCYRKIDIGTAKPGAELLSEVPYYNVSILDLRQKDSASDFMKRAEEWEREILHTERPVIYAGGSTLHLQALIRPLDQLPPADPENLALLQNRLKEEGLPELYRELARVDPVTVSRMDGMNPNRILRALDVWMQSGRPYSSFHKLNEPVRPPDDLLVYGLHWEPRKLLHERIGERTLQMLEEGLVAETESILSDGYPPDLQALNTVGYREVIRHLKGEIPYRQMVHDIQTATRRYARRQLTWFRRWEFVRWFDAARLSIDEMARQIQLDLAAELNKG